MNSSEPVLRREQPLDRPSSALQDTPWNRWLGLSSPRRLMIAAVVVHALVVLFAIVYSWRGSALGDIAIYRGWAASGFVPVAPADGPAPTVYPILATLPMALAQVLGGRWFFAYGRWSSPC